MRSILRLSYLSVFFLFFSFSVNATNHYVDKNATSGGNNGTSWVNAWQSFSDINWGSIEPGDTIYISGGSDSKVYYERLYIGNVQGTAANPITIKNSYDAGHNGRVIIDGGDGTRNCILIGNSDGYSTDYFTFSGLELRGGDKCIWVHNRARSLIFDSLTVTDWTVNGLLTQGTTGVPEAIDGVTIQNSSWIGVPLGEGEDCLQFNSSSNHIIRNNFIHQRNSKRENNHVDGILALWSEGFRVYDNVIIVDSNAQGQAIIIRAWADAANEDPVIIYNNFMYQGGIWDSNEFPWTSVLNLRWQDQPPNVKPPTFVAHNTIVSNGRYVQGVVHEVPSTFVNNIVAQFGDGVTPSSSYWLASMRGTSGDIDADSIRNNIIWREYEPGSSPMFTGTWYGNGTSASNFGWSTWTGTLGGTGINANPLFVDQIGYIGDQSTLDGELQSGSPAINQGENIRAIIEGMGLPWTDINGHPRDNTPDIGAYQYVPQGPDLIPPEVTGATLLDSITLRITFSEPLDPSTAQNPNNYSINNGITVVSALLTGSAVTLTTSPHAYGTYTVTISNVEDIAGNIVSPTANSADYEWTVILDVTSPELIGVQIVEADKVVLDFSEPLDAGQVSNLGNYIISEQMQILSSELNTTQTRICLTTDEHLIEHIYTIEIHNLTDLAGNVISSQANSAFYKKLDIGEPGYVEHLIEHVDASATTDTNTSPQKTLDGLVNGDPDPNSRWAAEVMPQWIQFDLGAIKDINLIAISFYNWNNGRIYEYSIQISNDEHNWDEIVSNASSSSQEWTLNEFSPILSVRYVRIICESNNQANWAGVWEARVFEPDYPTSVETEPRTYALKQNYPNPFNPFTTIDYSVPKRSFISLSVFNAIGQEVAILIREEMEPGVYKITFNAANLSSGIYFYKLQSADFVETRKMVLLR